MSQTTMLSQPRRFSAQTSALPMKPAPPVTRTRASEKSFGFISLYQPKTCAKISGATIVASDSMMYFGVFTPSLPQVIFSFGTAPE